MSLPSGPKEVLQASKLSTLELVFLVLLVQTCVVLVLSLVLHVSPAFVGSDPIHGFSMDFYDFWHAGVYYVNGISPYAEKRFLTPPFSLLIGLPYQRLSFEEARYFWLIVNLACIGGALAAFAEQIGMRWRETALLFMIAGLFYPAHFLVERGNIDGVVMALLVFAFRARQKIASVMLYAASMGLKLYSGLLVFPLLRKKRWWLACGSVLLAAALQLPWWRFAIQYPQVLSHRTDRFLTIENISGALCVQTLFALCRLPAWKIFYAGAWVITLGLRLWRLSPEDDNADWVTFVPWMISMPFVVYPYSAILTLPLMAYTAQREPSGLGKKFLLLGFLLIGTQQNVWRELLSRVMSDTMWVYQLNSAGVVLMLAGSCAAAWQQGEKPAAATGHSIAGVAS